MEVIGVILSLVLLVTIAYRGFSVILFAPICALVAASLSSMDLLPGYTELFMGKAVVYIKSFFPIFLLGAVFGKVMEETGMAAREDRRGRTFFVLLLTVEYSAI